MGFMKVPLKQNEQEALRILADREYRDIRQQAAVIIRQELRRLGLLPVDNLEGVIDERTNNPC
jgi:hypothetical protein